MTRTKAMLWGAFCGALIGPAIGGLLFAVGVSVLPETGHLPMLETLGVLAECSLIAVFWFGAPGLFTGSLGGLLLRQWLPKLDRSLYAWLLSAAVGVLAAILSLAIFRAISKIYVLDWPFLLCAAVAGALTFGYFGRKLHASIPNP